MASKTVNDTYHRLFELGGRGFIVAGAGQGMGEAATRALSEYGARVLCVDRDMERAQQIAREVDGVAVQADITDEDHVERVVDTAVRELGRLDGLVDVPGGSTFTRIPDLETEEWDRQFAVNLRHAYFLGRYAGRRMAASGNGGAMVFVASASAFYGSRSHPAYSAAKAALVNWVMSLAEEFGEAGVRANAIAPGPTLTPRMAAAWNEEARREMTRPSMLGRLGRLEEIAGAVLFLCSDASGNVTGQTLPVDGGQTVRDPVYGDGRMTNAVAGLKDAQVTRPDWP